MIPLANLDTPTVERLFHSPPHVRDWSPRPVERATLDDLHALLSLCPASAPQSPGGFVFVASESGRARLLRHVGAAGTVDAIAAPVVAVAAYDRTFAEQLLCSAGEEGPAPKLELAADRAAVLQGAFLMVAARALGLEVRPIAAANFLGLSREFFAGARLQANFLCGLGYVSEAPRSS